MTSSQFLTKGMDYLGVLSAKLKDLQGFSALANELVQNADDAPGVSTMILDVRTDALIVDNNGIFSDCKSIELPECPWKQDTSKGHRCDFHRFRIVAGGDKREQAGTIGAFGIGFIAVYQITDQPELISSGRHWILHEDRLEHERIEVCPGCEKCHVNGLPNTRFILPWAKDPQSTLRMKLRAECITSDTPHILLKEMELLLPTAMLFLKNIESIEIKENGLQYRRFERLYDHASDSLILSDGDPSNDKVWHFLRGDFSDEANKLRDRHPGRIESKRSSAVTLAIPDSENDTGLLCAFLPTQHETGLPFHINADFFPSSDRKRVKFESDYESEWNRLGIVAAAEALKESLRRLPGILKHKRLWKLLSSLKEVADKSEQGQREKSFAQFWKKVEPMLGHSRLVYTTEGDWKDPAETVLMLQKEESPIIPTLEGLGVAVVHEDLRPYQNLLRSGAVNVQPLDITHLTTALIEQGLTRRRERQDWPACLKEEDALQKLWREIVLLLDRQRSDRARELDEKRLESIAIAMARDDALWPCEHVYRADDPTVSLFWAIDPQIPFQVELGREFDAVSQLCPIFDASAAIRCLEQIDPERLALTWQEGNLDLKGLFAWLEDRRAEIITNPTVKAALSTLPIFPSSGKMHRLNELALPGNFDDHLGLAELVDVSRLGGRREFLRDLGMPELDFRNYALSRLPVALGNETVGLAKRRAAVTLLANRLGEFKDDQEVRSALSGTPLIECADGGFRKAHSCYFESEAVSDCLAHGVHFALVPTDHQAAFRDLYEWLGVANEPRIDDLLTRVQTLSSLPYSPGAAQVIGKIVTHLGKAVEKALPTKIEALCIKAWLPAKGKRDRWYRPDELYAVYQAYLFETQGLFLDVPANIQRDSSVFLDLLGVKATPTANLVVKHLLFCCDKGLPVHQDVYRFLNDKAEDPALNLLKDKNCLLLGDSYLAPSQVFWTVHPFGRYRRRLSEELRSYNNFMRKIGVRDAPDHEDALKVLREIAAEFSRTNSPLDGEAHAVLMACWRSLENALDDNSQLMGEVALLNKVKCVPNFSSVLNPPEWMFFENRAGLAAKFGEFLKGNVMPRPLGASNAMAAAGVRSLGSAVEVHLLECADPSEDSEMTGRIRQRGNQFGRVLESQMPAEETVTALQRLEKLQCEAASSLLIRYCLSAFNRELESTPELVPALYLRDTERLLFIRRNGNVSSWSAVARELAIALFPDEDPGRIAAGIKEVLAAESTEMAAATLDELGFAGLDTSRTKTPEPGVPVDTLGAQTPPSGEIPAGTPSGSMPPGAAPSMTPEEAIKALLGPDAASPLPPLGGQDTEGKRPGGQGGTGTKVGIGKKKARPVLRSYLPAPDTQETYHPGGDDEEREARSPVDEAGVHHVLDHETRCGRFPKEMPHKNPGYDIESLDASGQVCRYIEVKSFSGQWKHTYADLSRPQFDKANELNDSFWLYIVESAEADDFKIHRIPNPVLRANHFMFDDGWSALAEQDDIAE